MNRALQIAPFALGFSAVEPIVLPSDKLADAKQVTESRLELSCGIDPYFFEAVVNGTIRSSGLHGMYREHYAAVPEHFVLNLTLPSLSFAASAASHSPSAIKTGSSPLSKNSQPGLKFQFNIGYKF